ncbi:MAG: hypothetical protein GWP17_04695 [Aquificales bacterium]|nr:hypothetical protein [Aquificales bacterium]
MMTKTDALLTRLDEIAQSVAAIDGCLGLLGLGSVGQERERLDNYFEINQAMKTEIITLCEMS